MEEKVLILDFGSQYTQLIARRVREFSSIAKFIPTTTLQLILAPLKQSSLSGSPFSVRAEDAPHPDLTEIRGTPLAVCYGAQYFAHFPGGKVSPSATREYGRANFLP